MRSVAGREVVARTIQPLPPPRLIAGGAEQLLAARRSCRTRRTSACCDRARRLPVAAEVRRSSARAGSSSCVKLSSRSLRPPTTKPGVSFVTVASSLLDLVQVLHRARVVVVVVRDEQLLREPVQLLRVERQRDDLVLPGRRGAGCASSARALGPARSAAEPTARTVSASRRVTSMAPPEGDCIPPAADGAARVETSRARARPRRGRTPRRTPRRCAGSVPNARSNSASRFP